jgi:hypothetical protein
MVGWDERSWGYHGDDGSTFCEGLNNIRGQKYGETYHKGDVIGCGINFRNKIAFFTKNGNIIGKCGPQLHVFLKANRKNRARIHWDSRKALPCYKFRPAHDGIPNFGQILERQKGRLQVPGELYGSGYA